MKALASNSPSFAKVKVEARSARNFYGVAISKPFDATKHENARK